MDAQLERAIEDQQALDELKAQAATPQDHEDLGQMQAELDTERKQALSTRLGQFTIQNGVVVPKAEVEAMRAAGQDLEDTYKSGRRA